MKKWETWEEPKRKKACAKELTDAEMVWSKMIGSTRAFFSGKDPHTFAADTAIFFAALFNFAVAPLPPPIFLLIPNWQPSLFFFYFFKESDSLQIRGIAGAADKAIKTLWLNVPDISAVTGQVSFIICYCFTSLFESSTHRRAHLNYTARSQNISYYQGYVAYF